MHKNNHKVLNEGFGDWLSSLNPFGGSKEDKKEEGSSFLGIKLDGHLALDAVGLVTGLVPGGQPFSMAADFANAIWYFNEGSPFIALMYVIMMIPVVGDLAALPIQGVLKFGSKGLSKLAPMIPQLYKNRLLIQSFLKRMPIVAEKIVSKESKPVIKGMSEELGKIFNESMLKYEQGVAEHGAEKAAELAAEHYATGVEKELAKTGGKAEAKVSEKTIEEISSVAAKKAEQFLPKAQYRAEQQLLKRALVVTARALGGSDDSAAPIPTPGPVPPGPDGGKECPNNKLKYNCKGDNVKALQKKLLAAGEKLPRKGVDGWFGPETKAAVISFQKANDLKVDGIAGPETLAKLNGGSVAKKQATKQPSKEASKTTDAPIEQNDQLPGYIDRGVEGSLDSGGNSGASVNEPDFSETPAQKRKKDNLPASLQEGLVRRRNDDLEQLIFKRFMKDARRF